MAGSIIQSTRRWDFKNGSRIGVQLFSNGLYSAQTILYVKDGRTFEAGLDSGGV